VTGPISFVRARLDERAGLLWQGDCRCAPANDTRQASVNSTCKEHGRDAWDWRDIAAKRAIVDAYEFAVEKADRTVRPTDVAILEYVERHILRSLAAIDRDHSDYDESWRP